MRLSDFHRQLAKECARGKGPKEILQSYKISSHRLSVIRANPLFRQEVDRQSKLETDKYAKAVAVYEREAEKLAEEAVNLAKSPAVSADTRFKIIDKIHDRVAQKSPLAQPADGEMVFEQWLRVTKRLDGHMDQLGDADLAYDPERAYAELMEVDDSVGEVVEMEQSTSPEPGPADLPLPDDTVSDTIPDTPSDELLTTTDDLLTVRPDFSFTKSNPFSYDDSSSDSHTDFLADVPDGNNGAGPRRRFEISPRLRQVLASSVKEQLQ